GTTSAYRLRSRLPMSRRRRWSCGLCCRTLRARTPQAGIWPEPQPRFGPPRTRGDAPHRPTPLGNGGGPARPPWCYQTPRAALGVADLNAALPGVVFYGVIRTRLPSGTWDRARSAAAGTRTQPWLTARPNTDGLGQPCTPTVPGPPP